MKKIYYNKLIRDKIPERIKESGGDFKIRKLRAKEFKKELMKKVAEEATGLLTARTKKELISELADILDLELRNAILTIKFRQFKNSFGFSKFDC